MKLPNWIANIFTAGCPELKRRNNQLETERIEYIREINVLQKQLNRVYIHQDTYFPVAPATDYITGETQLYDLREIYRPYNPYIADTRYIALTEHDWKNLLKTIHSITRNQLQYTPEEADCDDYALTTQYLVMRSFDKANQGHQAALVTAWSTTHAYNQILTTDGRILIYEPQTGKTMGQPHNNTDPKYITTKIMAPH